MKIECVITCVNYGDFLEHSLPENMSHLDRVVVVTTPEDKHTQAVCRKFSVQCVQTSCFTEGEDEKFNKGRGINLGLGHLQGLDWILHLDADVVLPHNFRNLLHRHKLDQKNIYGADRLNVYGYEKWMAHKHKAVPHYTGRYFVDPMKEFSFGARIVHEEHGYCPIGYFQLWHKSAGKKYPYHQGNAEHTDVLFAAMWPRAHRLLLPEVLVYHLESTDGPAPMGANWNGRKTPIFGPKQYPVVQTMMSAPGGHTCRCSCEKYPHVPPCKCKFHPFQCKCTCKSHPHKCGCPCAKPGVYCPA